jgi:hypothetical protein
MSQPLCDLFNETMDKLRDLQRQHGLLKLAFGLDPEDRIVDIGEDKRSLLVDNRAGWRRRVWSAGETALEREHASSLSGDLVASLASCGGLRITTDNVAAEVATQD